MPDEIHVRSFEQEKAEGTETGIESWLCSLGFLLLVILDFLAMRFAQYFVRRSLTDGGVQCPGL